MAIFSLAIPGSSIYLGSAVVLSGGETIQTYVGDAVNLGSGHDVSYYDVLEGRYTVPPTGWSA